MAAAAAASSSYLTYKGKRRAVIAISSSSSEDEEEEDASDSEPEDESGSEYEGESDEDDDDQSLSEDEDGSSNDACDADEDDCGDSNGDSKGKPTDEEHCSKIIDLLGRKRSLKELKLEECKAYLRKHDLRISGTKETCIERILEHWRIKDGNGEKLYPQSSFVINCTGDVCKGDVVLFKQRVYEKFDLVKRGGGGKILGKRIIAGRVVKESYGRDKQQHTFSVDVLWSKGVKALPPLFPLLVKGRNLYRMKTFRQRWTDETARSRVLAEKHRRGAAARHVRSIAKGTASGSKHLRNSSTARAPPNKRRKTEVGLATKKKKQNYSRQPSKNGHAETNAREIRNAGNSGPSAPSEQTSYHANAASRKKKQNRARQPSNGHANTRERVNSREPLSSAPSEQTRYHPSATQIGYPYPQISPCHNNFDQVPIYPFYRNNTGLSQPHPGLLYHHIQSYHAGDMPGRGLSYTSSAAAAPHKYMLDRTSNVRQPYGNLHIQPEPRSREFYDDRFAGSQFHGWRRP